ncbi:hypothetical protein [Kineosporia babensis]|uniref:Uncharacterized protein n=1 Tax=Kineosporia babensis TaxID=499548 RepID=A0A9X1NMI2_9ACTN|nr:hypothetical protein [Kineosporia babensis]MCD5316883.1 hypothetical protein [Kineosporia babensis]
MSHHRDSFWDVINAQIDALCKARTVQDVLHILSRQATQALPLVEPPGMSGDGFFAGSGGDATVYEALSEAGWSIVWYRAHYHWAMREPEGEGVVTYIEGDVYGRLIQDTQPDR